MIVQKYTKTIALKRRQCYTQPYQAGIARAITAMSGSYPNIKSSSHAQGEINVSPNY